MRLADYIREDFETADSFPNRIMLCTSFCRLCSSVLVLLPACLSVVSVHVRSLAFVRPCLPFSNVPLHSLISASSSHNHPHPPPPPDDIRYPFPFKFTHSRFPVHFRSFTFTSLHFAPPSHSTGVSMLGKSFTFTWIPDERRPFTPGSHVRFNGKPLSTWGRGRRKWHEKLIKEGEPTRCQY